jgi:hypothetical protein
MHADFQDKDPYLNIAVQLKKPDIIKALYDLKADINYTNRVLSFPLFLQ